MMIPWFPQPGWPVWTCRWRRWRWQARLRSASWEWSWRSWTRDWVYRTAVRSSGTSNVSHAADSASTTNKYYNLMFSVVIKFQLVAHLFIRFRTFWPFSAAVLGGGELSHIRASCFFVCVFCSVCSPVSHPQQRPSGHYSSAGCHGEIFPAWSGFATECEGWSCSYGSEFSFSTFFLSPNCVQRSKVCAQFLVNFPAGKQKWNKVRCTDGGPDGGEVSRFLSCVILWMWEKKHLIYIYIFFFFQQGCQLRLPQQDRKWVKSCRRLSRFDILNVIEAALQQAMTLTHFSGCPVTQGKIPSSNCWSLRLTRSTRWRRYNKERERSAELTPSSPLTVKEQNVVVLRQEINKYNLFLALTCKPTYTVNMMNDAWNNQIGKECFSIL